MKLVGPGLSGSGRIELRNARRMRVLQQAKIVVGAETMIHCEVRDLSAGGARILVKPHVHLPDRFDLFICAHDLRVHKARLRWRQGNFAGVSFGADEIEALPAPIPAPHLLPAAAHYPVLVRSNSLAKGTTEFKRSTSTAPIGAHHLSHTQDGPFATEIEPVRASVQTGRRSWERRRLRSRRTAV